jgi:hypothetical protein
MEYTQPWQRVCDCRCIVHHHLPRTTYNEPDCACAITCATQPTTLLANYWSCALFLDQGGNLWRVPAMANGTWDWASAEEIDSQSDHYEASAVIGHLLRQAAHLLRTSID